MSELSLTDAEILAAARDALAQVGAAESEDGPQALANPDRWELVDGPVFSTRHMDDETLRDAVLGDLIVAEDLRRGGRTIAMTAANLVRFLPPDQAARVWDCLQDPLVASLLARRDDGEIRIDPSHFQDACDLAGVWPEGVTPLTAEPVLVAHPDRLT